MNNSEQSKTRTRLYDSLIAFNSGGCEETLQEAFCQLAPQFLCGGYIKVGDDYRIYIKIVEFYYHEEEGAIKDPIVYHRNGKYPHRARVPYFPVMSIHAHASGYDIAFENEALQYRASALIRGYEIYDEHTKQFLILKKGKREDDRSTFLYDYLNGFSLQDRLSIKWVDDPQPLTALKVGTRRNVFQYDEHGVKTNMADQRNWSFTRIEESKP